MNNALPPREALRRMLRERGCPPLDLLVRGGPDIERHLQGCADCRADRAEYSTPESAAALADLEARLRALPEVPRKTVRPGEIRSICRSAVPVLYDEHGWHNPPRVLVLSTSGVSCRVAQLFDEPSLAEAGDVPLSQGNCFAESWNSYDVASSSLSAPLGMVAPEELEAVLAAVSEAGSRSRELDEDMYAALFRVREREVGDFFARQIAARSFNQKYGMRLAALRLSAPEAWRPDYALAAASRSVAAETEADDAFLFGPATCGMAMLADKREERGVQANFHIYSTEEGHHVLARLRWEGPPAEAAAFLPEDLPPLWTIPAQDGDTLELRGDFGETEPDLSHLRLVIFCSGADLEEDA